MVNIIWSPIQNRAWLFSQLMANFKVGGEGQVLAQKSHLSLTIDEDGSAQLIALPELETKISLLGNLFMSEGDGWPQVNWGQWL